MAAAGLAALILGWSAPVAAEEGEVRIRYLGASGLSIRRGADHLLTAPLFSNPSMWRVLFGRIAPDPSRFPPDVDRLFGDAAAILVGHSHYDHLLDIPALAPLLPPHAVIYGNETTRNILAAVPDFPVPVETLNDRAGDSLEPGPWTRIEGTSIRFMALRADHAPHIGRLRFYDGEYTSPRKKLPRRAAGWPLGNPLSFVIDLLAPDGETPQLRIYFQDAASDAPHGFPPPLPDGVGYDLAVICVANFEQVEEHPEAILERLQPRAVLLTHWEDFSRPHSKPIRHVPGTNIDEFMRRFRAALEPGTSYWMPEPGETITLRPASAPASRGYP